MKGIIRECLVKIEFLLIDLGDAIHRFHVKVKEFRWNHFEY
jgi:hypothetical protein